MTPAARASAAIEILTDIEARKRPAAEALKDWGTSHRFAGSGDRAAIGNLVFDCLRTRASAAYAMGEAARVRSCCAPSVTSWGMTPEEVAALADGGRHAPEPLTSEAELAGLAARDPRRRAGAYPGRLSGMARARIRARLRRPGGRGGGGAGPPRARRSQGQHAESRSRQGAEGAAPLRAAVHAAFALRGAYRAGAGTRQEPAYRGRARSRQRLVRGAGRGLAARHAACRRRGPASRSSISAPGPAARPWRSRR